jgi:hypothetical protein
MQKWFESIVPGSRIVARGVRNYPNLTVGRVYTALNGREAGLLANRPFVTVVGDNGKKLSCHLERFEPDVLNVPVKTVVRVVLENGNNWDTTINTDFAGAVDYFFKAGGFEQHDGTVSKVVAVIGDGKVVGLADYRRSLTS